MKFQQCDHDEVIQIIRSTKRGIRGGVLANINCAYKRAFNYVKITVGVTACGNGRHKQRGRSRAAGMKEETDKIKGITEDKNRGVDKHPLFSAAFLGSVISSLFHPTRSAGSLDPATDFPSLHHLFVYPRISPSIPPVKPNYRRCNIYVVLEQKCKNARITHKTGKIFSYHCVVYKQYNIYSENYIYTNVATHGGTFCKTAANMEIANTRKRNI
ncbi:hypothetical protein ALC62_08751 [Cyphomyrmex costatus]|uniref:Uncharacterized protein n=1 Tax=Cyphomyrmex costatus TaxID=456900 RepID=A0A195CJ36_9HYME|nr:hypothetical protein ALC62_08751 [Cyphomyrmex costatus]